MTKSLAAERDFAADASHQLRTPLTALLMRLEEIAATDDLDVVKEEANIAIAQVERLTRVVDDLMARTRAVGETGPAPSRSTRSSPRSSGSGSRPSSRPAAASACAASAASSSARPRSRSRRCSRPCWRTRSCHGRGTVDVHARRSGPVGRRRGQRPGRRRARGRSPRTSSSARSPPAAHRPRPRARARPRRVQRRPARARAGPAGDLRAVPLGVRARSEATEGEARDHRPGCRGAQLPWCASGEVSSRSSSLEKTNRR